MDLNLHKFKKGDTFKIGTGDTLYMVVRDESVTGIVWATVAGSTGGQFRFNNKYDDLTLMEAAPDPYEYLVQSNQIGTDTWKRAGVGEWTDQKLAKSRLRTFSDMENSVVEYGGRKRLAFRIVRRLKQEAEVFMTEEEL
jgi:hypothetical protein